MFKFIYTIASISQFFSFIFTYQFIVGIACGTIVTYFYQIIKRFTRERDHNRGIHIPHENGTLLITEYAIKEFVSRIISKFNNVSLHSINIDVDKKQKILILNLAIKLLPETTLHPLVDDIRNELITQAKEYTGISDDIQINISVRSFSAKESIIKKQAKKVGSEAIPKNKPINKAETDENKKNESEPLPKIKPINKESIPEDTIIELTPELKDNTNPNP